MSVAAVEGDRVTIWQGSAETALAEIETGSVGCVVTSPPYYGLRDYGTASWEGGDPECDHGASELRSPTDRRKTTLKGSVATIAAQDAGGAARWICKTCHARRVDEQIGLEATVDDYVARMVAVLAEVARTLAPTGTLWLNVGDSYGDRGLLGIPWRLALALVADGWYLRRDVIWAKSNAMPESVENRPSSAHEYVYLLTRRSTGYTYSHRGPKNVRSVWLGATANFADAHFAVMPSWLARRCILLGSKRDDLVLDPFAGSGTTLVEALALGRRAVGVELNPDSIRLARKRLAS